MLKGINHTFESEMGPDIYERYFDCAFAGITHHNGLCVILDGMCGEYTFIGRIIEKSRDGEMLNGPYSPDTYVEPAAIAMVSELISAQFNINNPNVKPVFFTHYR